MKVKGNSDRDLIEVCSVDGYKRLLRVCQWTDKGAMLKALSGASLEERSVVLCLGTITDNTSC